MTLISGTWSSAGIDTVGRGTEESHLFSSTPREVEWERQISRMYEIRRLKDNWDFEGAKAVNPIVVDSVLALLRDLRADQFSPPSRVGAAGDGTIALEWQLEGEYYSLEVAEPYRGDWMHIVDGRRPRHWRANWLREQPDKIWGEI